MGDLNGWKGYIASGIVAIALAATGYAGGDALAKRIAENDTKIAVLEAVSDREIVVAEAQTKQINDLKNAVNDLATQQRLLLQGIERDRRDRERREADERRRRDRG